MCSSSNSPLNLLNYLTVTPYIYKNQVFYIEISNNYNFIAIKTKNTTYFNKKTIYKIPETSIMIINLYKTCNDSSSFYNRYEEVTSEFEDLELIDTIITDVRPAFEVINIEKEDTCYKFEIINNTGKEYKIDTTGFINKSGKGYELFGSNEIMIISIELNIYQEEKL
ncbi:hypothetical protein NUSPORA_01697 [Nucleospora cyclopteri]